MVIWLPLIIIVIGGLVAYFISKPLFIFLEARFEMAKLVSFQSIVFFLIGVVVIFLLFLILSWSGFLTISWGDAQLYYSPNP